MQDEERDESEGTPEHPLPLARLCLELGDMRGEPFKPALGFLRTHRQALGLEEGEGGLLQAFLDRVWPDGVPATLIASNISHRPELNRDWLLRPVSWGPQAGSYAAAHQTLALHVYPYRGRLIVKKCEVTPHVQPREHERVISAPLYWNAPNLWMEPGDLAELAELPAHRAETSRRLEEWRGYLQWKQTLIKQQQLKVPYLARQWEEDGVRLTFLVEAEQLEERRLKGQELSAQPPEPEEAEEEQEPPRRPRRRQRPPEPLELGEVDSVGRVNPRDPAQRQRWGKALAGKGPLSKLSIRLDEEQAQSLRRKEEKLPEQGQLVSSIAGELSPLRNQVHAINRLQNSQGFCPRLADFLFSAADASVPREVPPLEPLADSTRQLNPEQKEAVAKALAAPDLCLIQGPPGTGKTTVIAELCLRVVREGGRVLVASQANLAVDNALSRLDDRPEIRRLRLGNMERIDEDYRDFLEANVVEHWFSTMTSACAERLEGTEQLARTLAEEEQRLQALRAALERHEQASASVSSLQAQLRELTRQAEPLARQVHEVEERKGEALRHAESWSALRAWAEGKAQAPASVQEHRLPALGALARELGERLAPGDPLRKREGLALLEAAYTRGAGLRTLGTLLEDMRRSCEAGGAVAASDSQLAGLLAERLRLASSEDPEETRRLPELNKQIKRLQGQDWSRLTRELSLLASATWGSPLPEAMQQLAEALQASPELLPALEATERLVEEAREAARRVERALPELAAQAGSLAEAEQAWAQRAGEQIQATQAELERLGQQKDGLAESLQQHQRQAEEAQARWEQAWRQLEPEGALLPPSAEALQAATERRGPRRLEQQASLERRRRWSRLQREWLQRLKRPSESDRDHLSQLYLRSANVVGMTCNEAGKRHLTQDPGFRPFDLVIIDEVSKATPTELIMPMLLGHRVVLVGDHRQLPPMFRERDMSFAEAQAEGEVDEQTFKRFQRMVTASLFQELFEQAPPQLKAMLWEQYRMHPQIMDAVNEFYMGRLRPGAPPGTAEPRQHLEGRRGHHLRVEDGRGGLLLEPRQHLLWVDSSRDERQQPCLEEQVGTSKKNGLEARLVVATLRRLNQALRQRGYGQAELRLQVGRSEEGLSTWQLLRQRLAELPETTLEDLFAERRVRVQRRSRKRGQAVQAGEEVWVDARRQVGVLTFYGAQLREIRGRIDEELARDPQAFNALELKTQTVDRFQGLERPIIIASLVRSSRNPLGGFVRQFQRINVGLSRAQELLVIIGAADSFRGAEIDLPTLEGGGAPERVKAYSNILEKARLAGGMRHAWQFLG